MHPFWIGVFVSIITHMMWMAMSVLLNDKLRAKRTRLIKRIILTRVTALAFVSFIILTMCLSENFGRYILQWLIIGSYLIAYCIANGHLDKNSFKDEFWEMEEES